MNEREIKGYVVAWDEEIEAGIDDNYWCQDENENLNDDALSDEEVYEAIKGEYTLEEAPDGNDGLAMLRRWTVYQK